MKCYVGWVVLGAVATGFTHAFNRILDPARPSQHVGESGCSGSPNRTPYAMAIACLLLAHAGCATLPQNGLSLDRPRPPAATTGVGIQSDGRLLGEADAVALAPEQLLAETADLLAEKKAASARRLVERHPDAAWELLRGMPPAGAESDALRAVASAHDAQCVRGAEGWEALLADRSKRPELYQRYAERRVEFLERLRRGRPGQALDVELLPRADGEAPRLLMVDAMQLIGSALLDDGRPAEAADAYQHGVAAAEGEYPYCEAQLRLQLSEALRHAERLAEADAAWLAAVGTATEGLRGTFDPGFWERAAYHRPVHQPWPAETTAALAALSRRYGLLTEESRGLSQFSRHIATETPSAEPNAAKMGLSPSPERHSQSADERFVWACIGQWRLERGEPEAALVALKRTHTLTVSPRDRGQLELAQAGALTAMDQSNAAAAMLISLSDSADETIARGAIAMLGTLRLEAGNTKQGYTFLRRALEEGDPVEWPGRAGAEADLGLAYLLLGNEQAGLRWLRGAQARFEADGADDLLLRSLENELAYLEQTKKKSEAEELRQRIGQLESDGEAPRTSRLFGAL